MNWIWKESKPAKQSMDRDFTKEITVSITNFFILRIKEEDRITRSINMLVGIRQLIICSEQDFFKYSHLTFNHTCLHK